MSITHLIAAKNNVGLCTSVLIFAIVIYARSMPHRIAPLQDRAWMLLMGIGGVAFGMGGHRAWWQARRMLDGLPQQEVSDPWALVTLFFMGCIVWGYGRHIRGMFLDGILYERRYYAVNVLIFAGSYFGLEWWHG